MLAEQCLIADRPSLCLGQRSDDVTVTLVGHTQSGHGEQLTAGSAEVVVAAAEQVHLGVGALAGKHGVVLQLRLAQSGAVACDHDQLGGSLAHVAQGLAVAQGEFAGLDHQLQASVDALCCLLCLLGHHDLRTKQESSSRICIEHKGNSAPEFNTTSREVWLSCCRKPQPKQCFLRAAGLGAPKEQAAELDKPAEGGP